MQGPFEYPDKGVYFGTMKDNLRIGRGKYMFPDGSFYEGYWKDDMPYGFG